MSGVVVKKKKKIPTQVKKDTIALQMFEGHLGRRTYLLRNVMF